MSGMSETLSAEVLLRMDRAVGRFEDAWRRGEPMPLEDLFRGEAAPAARAELLRYALAVELKYRRDRGERPQPEEYRDRFPGYDAAIADAFTVVRLPGPRPQPAETRRDADRNLLF